jgi:hypothetical protein
MIIHERANGIIVESMRGEKAPKEASRILAESRFEGMLKHEIRKLNQVQEVRRGSRKV